MRSSGVFSLIDPTLTEESSLNCIVDEDSPRRPPALRLPSSSKLSDKLAEYRGCTFFLADSSRPTFAGDHPIKLLRLCALRLCLCAATLSVGVSAVLASECADCENSTMLLRRCALRLCVLEPSWLASEVIPRG